MDSTDGNVTEPKIPRTDERSTKTERGVVNMETAPKYVASICTVSEVFDDFINERRIALVVHIPS